MFKFPNFNKLVALAVLLSASAFASVAYANHSWGNYHWARTANPLSLKLADNVSFLWDSYLATASSGWSASSVLDTAIVAGGYRGNCRPTNGRVEVCNKTYGNNGWLGIASIWINGSHITQGTVKLNDTYFNTPYYNTSAWKNLVMCQEIGHTFGLNHQDEDFYNANLGTCMDYTNDPDGGIGGAVADDPSNEHPNAHDYDQLATIYSHFDTFTSAFSKAFSAPAVSRDDIDTSDAKEWGREVRKSKDGRSSLRERDLGRGNKIFTFIIWANEGITE